MSDRVLDQLNLQISSVDLIWLCWEYAGAPFCMMQGPRCEGSYLKWDSIGFPEEERSFEWEAADAEYMALLLGIDKYMCCPYNCIHRLPNNK
jgi:hypothetical protein